MKFIKSFLILIFFTYHAFCQEEVPKYILKGHKDMVNAVAFSQDDTKLLTGGEDKMILEWNVETGEMTKEIEAHYGAVREIMYLKDGVTLLSAGDNVVKTWNTLLEPQEDIWTHHTYVWSFDVSPKMDKMVCGSFEKKIYLWNLMTDELIGRLEAHEKTTLAVAYSPNGKYFASGSLDQKVFIWNAANLETEKAGIGHAENIYDLEFTPNSRHLISVSKDKMTKIWNVADGSHYKTMAGHTDAVMCLSIHPNNVFAITGSVDGTIRLWDIKLGKVIFSYIGHEAAINDVQFSHNGKYFASASADQSAFLWELSPKVIAEFYFADELSTMLEGSSLFDEKRKSESRSEYNERLERATKKKAEVYQEFYSRFIENIDQYKL